MDSLNDPSPKSEARRPRGAVFVNGQRAAGMVSFQVDNNSFYQADTFRCVLSISAQPKDRGLDWWLNQEQVEVELLVGFPADPESYTKAELSSLLIGYVDDLEIDPCSATITLTGRDHTSKLIDTKSDFAVVAGEKALKASAVATRIAQSVGLNPVVTESTSASGSYYKLVKSIIESHTTYWNILARLAQMEKFVVYVEGNNLHFEPRKIASGEEYVIRWTPPNDNNGFPMANVARITFSRNLYIARDITVRVISHGYKTDRPITVTAEKTRVRNSVTKGAGSSSQPPVEYVYQFPNMNHADAQAKANALLLELSQHEMNMHASMPADNILSARNLIRVQGTGSRADQTYYPASIVRTFSVDEGYQMEITAKNISPDVEMPQ